MLWYFNIIAVILLIVCMAVFIHISQNILKPFLEFSDMPYQLAKGNLIKTLKENIHKKVGEIEGYLADIVQNESGQVMQVKVILRYI